jgi:hypothetical protein
MPDTKSHPLDWALWFFWIIATTVGWVIGSLFFSGIPLVASGVAIAALQWAVLNHRIERAWRWVVVSSVGWIIGVIFLVILAPTGQNILAAPLMGGILGLGQWFVLRHEVEWAGWWIVSSILAWTIGLVIMPGSLTSGSLPGAITGLNLIILFRDGLKKARRY